MSCGCDCDWEADGYTEFSSTRKVRARKPHHCDECGGVIQPGETYDRCAGKWEGDFYCNVICELCAQIWKCHTAGMVAAADHCGCILGELRCAVGCMARQEPKYLAAFRVKWKELQAAA